MKFTFEVTEKLNVSGIPVYVANCPEDYDKKCKMQPFAFCPKPAETPIGAIQNLVTEMLNNSHELDAKYLVLIDV